VSIRVASGTYTPVPSQQATTLNTAGVDNNGAFGNLAQINQRNGEQVTLEVVFERDGEEVIADGEFAFVDLDNGLCSCDPMPVSPNCLDCPNCDGGRDVVTVPLDEVNNPQLPFDSRDFILFPNTSMCQLNVLTAMRFYATAKGSFFGGEDNPPEIGTNPFFNTTALDDFQKGAGFSFIFSKRTSVSFDWQVLFGQARLGRNILFGINIFDCDN